VSTGQNKKHKTKAKSSRRENENHLFNKTTFIVIGVLVLSAMGVVFFDRDGNAKQASDTNVNVKPDTLPGIQISEAPWQPELNHLRERLSIIGLPALAKEGKALHTHQSLDLFIKGKIAPVPGMIGINLQELFISPIHTHKRPGEIHIESPTVRTFTLGQFFDIWGVRFTSKCIGSYCKDKQNSIKVFVNGKAAAGDPRSIELTDHQKIIVTYGTSGELSNLMRSQQQSPPGL